jgi:hypothetical protein
MNIGSGYNVSIGLPCPFLAALTLVIRGGAQLVRLFAGMLVRLPESPAADEFRSTCGAELQLMPE